jgi:hypothetical protein
MSTKNTKGKVVAKSQPTKEVKEIKQDEPVVQAVVQPVVQPVVEVKQAQKGVKKTVKQPEPVVEVKQTQKGGNKTTKQPTEPVQSEAKVETKQASKAEKKETVKQMQVEQVVEDKVVQKVAKKSSKQSTEPKVEKVLKVDKVEKAQKAQKVEKVEKVEVEAEADIEGEEGEEQGGKLRYFKLFYNEEYQGRYCGRKPKQAANKAFSSIIKDMKKNGTQKGGVDLDINFSIRECTRNSRHKEYKYVGVREQLKEPVEVKIKNDDGSVKEITYSFHNKISKAPKTA